MKDKSFLLPYIAFCSRSCKRWRSIAVLAKPMNGVRRGVAVLLLLSFCTCALFGCIETEPISPSSSRTYGDSERGGSAALSGEDTSSGQVLTPYTHTAEGFVNADAINTVASAAAKPGFDVDTIDDSFCAYILNRFYLSRLCLDETFKVFCINAYISILTSQVEYIVPGGVNISADDMRLCVYALMDDCPELFNVSNEFSYSVSEGTNNVVKLTFSYIMTPIQYADALYQTYAAIEKWSVDLAGKSEVEKEFALCISLYDKCVYSRDSAYCNSAYGAIVLGEALCEGYSNSIIMMMHYHGIEVCRVGGDARNPETNEYESHSWNLISLGGQYYHLDATWDDYNKDLMKGSAFAYFNLTDDEIFRTRSVSERYSTLNLPACNAVEYSYYSMSGLRFHSGAAEAEVRSLFLKEVTSAVNAAVISGNGAKTVYTSVFVKAASLEQYTLFRASFHNWLGELNKDTQMRYKITTYTYSASAEMYVVRFDITAVNAY